jgi:hypothetical protein
LHSIGFSAFYCTFEERLPQPLPVSVWCSQSLGYLSVRLQFRVSSLGLHRRQYNFPCQCGGGPPTLGHRRICLHIVVPFCRLALEGSAQRRIRTSAIWTFWATTRNEERSTCRLSNTTLSITAIPCPALSPVYIYLRYVLPLCTIPFRPVQPAHSRCRSFSPLHSPFPLFRRGQRDCQTDNFWRAALSPFTCILLPPRSLNLATDIAIQCIRCIDLRAAPSTARLAHTPNDHHCVLARRLLISIITTASHPHLVRTAPSLASRACWCPCRLCRLLSRETRFLSETRF